MQKILHIASFKGNIGDNANHKGMRKIFEERMKQKFQWDELEIRKAYYNYKGKDLWKFDNNFANLANQYSLILIGGGNFFDLQWSKSATGTTIDLPMQILSKIKTPVVFFGLGCDRYKGPTSTTILKFKNFLDYSLTRKNVLISVRNDGSFQTLKHLYGNKYNNTIYKVPDGGMFYSSSKNNSLKTKKYIGINIANDMEELRFSKNYKYNDFAKDFSSLLDNIILSDDSINIIFFPHIYSDLNAIFLVLKNMTDFNRRSRVLVAPYMQGNDGAEYIFDLYQQCFIHMGMRFHANLVPISLNIPTIGLASYPKLFDLYKELDIQDRCIWINKKKNIQKIIDLYQLSQDNNYQIKTQYHNIKEKQLKEINHFFDQVKYFLNK